MYRNSFYSYDILQKKKKKKQVREKSNDWPGLDDKTSKK